MKQDEEIDRFESEVKKTYRRESDQEQIDLQSNRLVDDRDQPALRRTLFTRHADRIVQMNIGRMQYMSERRHESRLGLALSDLISTDRHHRLSCFMDLLFTLDGRGAQGGRGAPRVVNVQLSAKAFCGSRWQPFRHSQRQLKLRFL